MNIVQPDTLRQRARREALGAEGRYLAYRVRILPSQLEHARRRFEMLSREAERLGMADLLERANA